MKVLFDTNVVIDALTERDYDYKDSRDLLIMAVHGKIKGYIVSKQVTDIYYILRKYISDESVKKQIMSDLCDTFTVLPFLSADIKPSISSPVNDFEDAVLEEVAKVNVLDCIVTNNTKHFKDSRLVVFDPHNLAELMRLPA